MKKIAIAVPSILMLLMGAFLAGCDKGRDTDKSNTIGIIGALEEEVSAIKKDMDITNATEIAGMEFIEGTLGDSKVVLVQCGMGKVNAGICANTLIHDFGCAKIINTGVAGSLDNNLDIGDIVVSVDAVQHDFDVEPIGFKKGEIPFTGKVYFEADEKLRAEAVKAVKESAPDIKVYEGRICSGDQFISTSEQKDKITSEYGGLCCEMEGGAIAQACYLNDTPFVIIRAISDKSDGSQHVEYETFKEKAAAHCALIVQHMMEDM